MALHCLSIDEAYNKVYFTSFLLGLYHMMAENEDNLSAYNNSRLLARIYDKNGRKRRHVRFVLAEAKLESEYIRRFLGQLSPLEESRLCELKYGLQDVLKVSFNVILYLKIIFIFKNHTNILLPC